jgi:hypothetical protein
MRPSCAGLKHAPYWADSTSRDSQTASADRSSARQNNLMRCRAEAELGTAIQNAQKAAEFRNTLQELGYPQEATVLSIRFF